MNIIKNKKFFIGFSSFLVAISVVSIFVFGLEFGIEFKGGALTEISFIENERPNNITIENIVSDVGLGEVIVQEIGENGFSIKTRNLTEEERVSLISSLEEIGGEEEGFTSIGPSVGQELARKAVISIILVSLGIILFLAYAFRQVSKPISSWTYGFVAIVTLIHDIVIPVGVFAFLSSILGYQIDTLVVLAVLTILGLSVSDTIVIFDRIRENLKNSVNNIDFSDIVNNSITQSTRRSINTSLTTILVAVSLFIFGPDSTKNFAMLLGIGLIVGTYSSLFLASPILAIIYDKKKKREEESLK